MDTLTHGASSFELARFPLRHNDPLRAWDAADEYILHHLDETQPAPGSRVLIVGDSFGALTCVLHRFHPTLWTDSFLGREAAAFNLKHNDLEADSVAMVTGDQDPAGEYDLVLIKAPKALDALEDILIRLRSSLKPTTQIILGSMIKHTPGSVYKTLERVIGPTTTSLGRKKARLALTVFDSALEVPTGGKKKIYEIDEFDLKLGSRPGVFSGDKLDLGTRVLLGSVPKTEAPIQAADLGCGNGALGLALARRCPHASVIFVDESDLAVVSARENSALCGLADHDFEFRVADGLADQDFDTLDLVLCNPPFHQAQAVGDQIAWRMFEQAKRALKPGGDLLVVGNRHLGYHIKLQRLFGNADVVDSDERFVVLRGRYRGEG